jgi:serine/threonine protein phosphatase PrpC
MYDNPTHRAAPKTPVPVEDHAVDHAGAASAVAVSVCGATDIGCVRSHNEDAFTIADLSSDSTVGPGEERRLPLANGGLLLMVCDGMGGHAAGEVAARLAGEVVTNGLRDMVDTIGNAPAASLGTVLALANRKIFEESSSRDDERGMGTTCTAGLLFAKHAVFAEVGDSRAYLFRAGVLTQLTHDQSLVATMLEAGLLPPGEVKNFPHTNVILQALGVKDTVEPVTSEIEIEPGDLILLSSDGLHGPVSNQEIADILRSTPNLTACTQALIDAALAAGGPDNVTVILARYEAAPQPQA